MFVIGPLNHEHRDSTNTVGVLMNLTPMSLRIVPAVSKGRSASTSGSNGLRTVLRHNRGKLKGKLHPRTGYEGIR